MTMRLYKWVVYLNPKGVPTLIPRQQYLVGKVLSSHNTRAAGEAALSQALARAAAK